MTKYLTTYQDLIFNIGKEVKFFDKKANRIYQGVLIKREDNITITAYGYILGTIEEKINEEYFDKIELIEEDNQEIPIKIDNALKSKIEEQLSNQEDPFKTNSPLKIRLGEEKELNNINHPSHYQLEINNKLVDVNTILEAISKKLDGKCDLMTWNYFSNACEYLLRSFFKGQQLSDLQKAKKEIEFIINKLEK
jgi:hypothetical protein